jgi:PAS domain S-box-containing protein
LPAFLFFKEEGYMSIKTKLILLFTSISLIFIIGFSSHIYGDWKGADKRAASAAQCAAEALAFSITSVDKSAGSPPIYKRPSMLNDYITDTHSLLKQYIVVVDVQKKIFGDAITANIGKTFDNDKNNEVGQTIEDGILRTFIKKGGEHPEGARNLVLPLKTEEGETVGALIFEYTSYYDVFISDVKEEANKIFMGSILFLLLIAIAGYVISSKIASPVVRLKNAAEEIAGGNLDVKVDIDSRDEIGRLASSFNNMAALRKKSEESLRSSEERFRLVTEYAGDAIIGIKSPGIICMWNMAAAKIFGYTEGEAMGKNMHDLIVPERYREKANEGLTAFFKSGTGSLIGGTIGMEALRRDGKEFPVELSISAARMEGEWRAIGVVRDVTERKMADDKIRRVNKDLNDFAYIVSHDLKAPLRAIGTITNWLAEDYKDKLDDGGREQLKTLLNRTQRMHNMIEAILQYSRAGRVVGTPERLDSRKIVRGVIEALLPPHNIKIVVHERMPEVFFDPMKLSQIFQNFISNAIKYMDKEDGLIEVGCVDRGDLCEFFVKDNGPGIEERHFERIFQIFQTLKPRDEYESTGIGLTIVKKIVESSGGRVWVESDVGKGSIFRFTIPKKEFYES